MFGHARPVGLCPALLTEWTRAAYCRLGTVDQLDFVLDFALLELARSIVVWTRLTCWTVSWTLPCAIA